MSKLTQKDKELIKVYDPSKYERPSVTVDIVVLTLDDNGDLAVELVKRHDESNIYNNCWALPGGFVKIDEDIDTTAITKLKDKTGIVCDHIEQFVTMDDVKRDPRMRVISIAYMAFIPKSSLRTAQIGDSPSNAELFKIVSHNNGMKLWNASVGSIDFEDLAFDHGKIINTALYRIRNRIEYTKDAFYFLENKDAFTIRELLEVYEKFTGRKTYDASNFTRDFNKKWVDTGVVKALGTTRRDLSRRPAALYKFLG